MSSLVKVPHKPVFKKTTAIRKLRTLRKRIRVIPGGTSAGKTYGILPVLIQRAIKTQLIEISVVSESMPHLKRGAIKDFKKIMKQTGRWKRSHWHESDKIYTFNNGSTIEFFSVDDESKVRGPRRNVLYVNECNNIKFETYYQLLIRTDMEVYLDYNPTHEFWIDEHVIGNKNVEVLRLTYKDNDALSKTIVNELESNLEKAFHNTRLPWDEMWLEPNIKSAFWANWCKVYLYGLTGTLEGAVYNNWKQVKNIPPEARLVGYGLDFGYSNDPTALIACYKYNGKTYFDQVVYQAGLKTRDLVDLMKDAKVRKDIPIYCDSADPKYRDELNEYGFTVIGATKGADSIKFGIGLLQDGMFYVTQRSLDMIKELRAYCWKKNRDGNRINVPIDAFNHAMDAIRYFAMMSMSKVVNNDDGGIDYMN